MIVAVMLVCLTLMLLFPAPSLLLPILPPSSSPSLSLSIPLSPPPPPSFPSHHPLPPPLLSSVYQDGSVCLWDYTTGALLDSVRLSEKSDKVSLTLRMLNRVVQLEATTTLSIWLDRLCANACPPHSSSCKQRTEKVKQRPVCLCLSSAPV